MLVAGQTPSSGGLSDFALVRYHANGTLDAGFGNGGEVITDLSSAVSGFCCSADAASAVALQADGGIVVAGGFGSGFPTVFDFAVVRYLGDTAGGCPTITLAPASLPDGMVGVL